MSKLTKGDYPLAETRPGQIRGKRGVALDEITLEQVRAGAVTMEDLQITAGALTDQAEIAADAGRPALALNFGRAAELVDVPQEVIMRTYELLRPGRAKSRAELDALAARYRREFGAEAIAAFIEEAAAVYEKRGLFTKRF